MGFPRNSDRLLTTRRSAGIGGGKAWAWALPGSSRGALANARPAQVRATKARSLGVGMGMVAQTPSAPDPDAAAHLASVAPIPYTPRSGAPAGRDAMTLTNPALSPAYPELTRRLADLSAIEEAIGILQWDQEIVMPPGAADARARQIATLAVLHHERLTHPRHLELLSTLQGDGGGLDDVARANVREAARDHRRASRIPPDLVRAWGEATVKAHEIWVDARKHADFERFRPMLEHLVELAQRRAAAIDPHRTSYDVLLDEFEPGMPMARLDTVFAPLRDFLVPFIAQVKTATDLPDVGWLHTPVPVDLQREAGEAIVRAMGYDFHYGRLDVAVHPFCGGAGPTDVRITTRYKETHFTGSLMAMVHETGHALYEQGRNRDLGDQPVSRPRSYGIHESQSLLWEKQVGQGAPFWTWHFPRLQERYAFLRGLDFETFLFGLNRVDFGNFIRVDADELTYPLHVILRYEIERDLFSGKLAVRDLPEAWNAKMQAYLGITPPDARLGVLQDVHWSSGSFGYFPSYTLGAMYAAQFWRAALRDVPGIPDGLATGDVGPLVGWLRTHVHRPGSRWETDELVRRATGEALEPAHFIDYLRAKYTRLYRLPAGV
ncbi:MAG: carboxypeptidase M32 [Myxococcales bacterium]|nr:carboxypeptidase M32 [Myxococcales bacterium]